jgi:hypothetical protein
MKKPFIFKGLTTGTCSYYSAESATYTTTELKLSYHDTEAYHEEDNVNKECSLPPTYSLYQRPIIGTCSNFGADFAIQKTRAAQPSLTVAPKHDPRRTKLTQSANFVMDYDYCKQRIKRACTVLFGWRHPPIFTFFSGCLNQENDEETNSKVIFKGLILTTYSFFSAESVTNINTALQ